MGFRGGREDKEEDTEDVEEDEEKEDDEDRDDCDKARFRRLFFTGGPSAASATREVTSVDVVIVLAFGPDASNSPTCSSFSLPSVCQIRPNLVKRAVRCFSLIRFRTSAWSEFIVWTSRSSCFFKSYTSLACLRIMLKWKDMLSEDTVGCARIKSDRILLVTLFDRRIYQSSSWYSPLIVSPGSRLVLYMHILETFKCGRMMAFDERDGRRFA